MAKSYLKPMPDDEVFVLLRNVRDRWHDELDRHKVTIGVTYVSDGSGAPCLRRRGNVYAAATIQITSLQHRLHGAPDALLTIDGVSWCEKDTDVRLALLDHELFHLIVENGADSACKLDDARRPMLKMRPHDFEIGGFNTIMDRHGSSAVERKNLELVLSRDRQLSLAFDQPSAVKRAIADKLREVAERRAEEAGSGEGTAPEAEPEATPGPESYAVSGPPDNIIERHMWALAAATTMIGRDCETLGFLKGDIERPMFESIYASLKRLEADPEAPPSWEFWAEFSVLVEAIKGMAVVVWDPANGMLSCNVQGGPAGTWLGEERREGEDLRAFAERVVNNPEPDVRAELENIGGPIAEEGEPIDPAEPEPAEGAAPPADPPGQPPGLIGCGGIMTHLDIFRSKTVADAHNYYGAASLTVDALSGERGTWEALNACAKAMAEVQSFPGWDRWSEFTIPIPGKVSPQCLFDPTCGDNGQLEIHGPINADGLLVLHGKALDKSIPLADFAMRQAEAELRAHKAAQEKAKSKRKKGNAA